MIAIVVFAAALIIGAEGAASSIGFAGAVAAMKGLLPGAAPPSMKWVATTALRLLAYFLCFLLASEPLRIVLVVAAVMDFATQRRCASSAVPLTGTHAVTTGK